MATTIAAARAKLAVKIPFMASNYNESMAGFLGTSPGQIAASPPGAAYAAKVTPGMEIRWESNLRRAFGL